MQTTSSPTSATPSTAFKAVPFFGWSAVAVAFIVAGFASQASDSGDMSDVLYDYSFAVGTIVIYAVLAAVVLARADLIAAGVPRGVVHTAMWAVVAYFLLGVGLNLASGSKPERAVMAPVSALLCASSVVVALS